MVMRPLPTSWAYEKAGTIDEMWMNRDVLKTVTGTARNAQLSWIVDIQATGQHHRLDWATKPTVRPASCGQTDKCRYWPCIASRWISKEIAFIDRAGLVNQLLHIVWLLGKSDGMRVSVNGSTRQKGSLSRPDRRMFTIAHRQRSHRIAGKFEQGIDIRVLEGPSPTLDLVSMGAGTSRSCFLSHLLHG